MYLKTDYNNRSKPDPPTAASSSYCLECGLTWLVGRKCKDIAAKHPVHATLDHEYAGTRRSLVVHIDSICTNNGLPNARAVAGLYFGPGSSYNVSIPLTSDDKPTNQKAELWAGIHAMQITREKIVSDCAVHVYHSRNLAHFRLVLVTDSSYLVEGMCLYFKEWKVEKRQGNSLLIGKNGQIIQSQIIQNSTEFLRLKSEVELLSMVGV